MTNYRVHLMQTVFEETWVTVTAENEEAAEQVAIEKVLDENYAWSFVESTGNIEAVHIEQEPDEPDSDDYADRAEWKARR